MFIVNSNNLDEKSAISDMTCYKKLYMLDVDTYVSPCIGFKYQVDKLYELGGGLKKIPFLYSNIVEQGFHSYKPNAGVIDHIGPSDNTVIVECVIPKGSKYYENNYEYVSDAIIVKVIAPQHPPIVLSNKKIDDLECALRQIIIDASKKNIEWAEKQINKTK